MTWICERCRCAHEAGYSIRIKADSDSDLMKHSVPANADLCFACALYLLWSRIFPGGIRRFWDDYYFTGKVRTLGERSRYGYVCRQFDVFYGFLDPETNKYWDEE